MSIETEKKLVAQKAISYIEDDVIVGVGTGSTVNYFIDELAKVKGRLEGCVASSLGTLERLKAHNIPVLDSNSVSQIDVYIDGADEANARKQLIKGGGAALTGEKILRAMSKQFICMVNQQKIVKILGEFPLPVEVIPLARSYVARELVKLGGDPAYREGVQTDYGNCILDVYNLNILDPIELEFKINQMPGVVCNGLFAANPANVVLVAEGDEVTVL